MASKGVGFSIADLQSGSKRLNTVAESKSPAKASEPELDPNLLASYRELYERYNGDLDLIFEELGESPEKAKKPHHRPKNADEFAEQYMKGFYSVVTSSAPAEEKHHK